MPALEVILSDLFDRIGVGICFLWIGSMVALTVWLVVYLRRKKKRRGSGGREMRVVPPAPLNPLLMNVDLSNLHDRCAALEITRGRTTRQILEPFGLLEGHPWAETAMSELTTYYACLYGVAQPEQPRKILEIGTAFGMSAATFLSASPDAELFVSLDLGIYGGLLGSQQNNIDFTRSHIHEWCGRHQVDTRRVRFYRANTQPPGQGDNDNQGLDAPRWCLLPEVVRLLQEHQFGIVFVDGKHTDDGLLNDMKTFWPFLQPGGLMICDDLHHPEEYAGAFSWVGHTWQSFHRFLEERSGEIAEHVVWNFPQVPPKGKMGLRPFGLVRKLASVYPEPTSPQFEMFDSAGPLAINRARQDHLASLGLDLAGRSVLEVGAGVGWHTAFFERLGCSILSTDARPENAAETLRRFPYRAGRVQVADLSVPGSHDRFGDFDIVYCYGTLYHVRDPALCLADLARCCRGLLLLETCVHHCDNGQLNLVAELGSNPNQSYEGMGCRPGRDWIMQELRKHFPHVYVSVTQPDFPDFELNWPAPPKTDGVIRAVFVASRTPLVLPTLSGQLPVSQQRLNSVLELGAAATPAVANLPALGLQDFLSLNPQTGQILLPAGVKRVWLDVGAHECQHSLPALEQNSDLAVIAFEPLPHKWQALRGRHERLIALPYAVSGVNSTALFNESEFDAASSLLAYNPDGHAEWKVKTGLTVKRQLQVQTIRLEEVLSRLPVALVEFIKIDTQGHDLEVVKSAGASLARVIRLRLEVAVTHSQLYVGAATKTDVQAWLEAHGFWLEATESQTNGQEENLTFVNHQFIPAPAAETSSSS
jgi:FkbM family methyltransferase